jgi:hypothetical protein
MERVSELHTDRVRERVNECRNERNKFTKYSFSFDFFLYFFFSFSLLFFSSFLWQLRIEHHHLPHFYSSNRKFHQYRRRQALSEKHRQPCAAIP